MLVLCHLPVVLCSLLLLTGCEKRWGIKVDVLDGEFVTPLGTQEIGLVAEIAPDDRRFKNRPEATHRFLRARDDRVQVDLAVFPQQYSNEIIHDKALGETLEIVDLRYELSGQEYPIGIQKPPYYLEEAPNDRRTTISYHRLELPGPLDDLKPTIQGGSVVWGTIASAQSNEDKVHRLTMKFLLDDEEYLFDVRFRVEVEVHRYLGVPGAGALP